RSTFARRMLEMLTATEAPHSALEFEITASMLMENIDETIAQLLELRDHGVSIQIDDFGTGYSSLQVLSRLPVDALKIDRSFVNQLGDGLHGRTVVQTTITLAQTLGLKTIAEGVETKEQLHVLKELGCTSVQGFLVGPPLPASELGQWLNATGGRLQAGLLDEHATEPGGSSRRDKVGM